MDNTINGRTPEEIKRGLECCNAFNACLRCPYEKIVDTEHGWGCVVIRNADTLAYIQQLERERDAAVDAAKVKPFTWEEAIQDDCFLEIKDDEYIDAALNIFASSHDEFDEEDHISYLTNNTPEDEILILYRGDYNRKWRCWPRRPTDEERTAAEWEVNESGKESSKRR